MVNHDDGGERDPGDVGAVKVELLTAFAEASTAAVERAGVIGENTQKIAALRDVISRLEQYAERARDRLNGIRRNAYDSVLGALLDGETTLKEAFPVLALAADRAEPSHRRTEAILEVAT